MAQESPTHDQKTQSQPLTMAATTLINSDSRQIAKTTAILVGGAALGTLLYKAYQQIPSRHSSIPTAPQFHRLLGHVPFLKQNYETMHDSLSELFKDYEIVAMKMPDFYQIFLLTPQLCEWVFTTEFDKFWKSPSQNAKIECVFGKYGDGIFVSDDKHWRFHRKIGSRMFSMRNLRDYMFGCCVDTTATTMAKLESLRTDGQSIDINDILGRMTFDCFTSIAFGSSFDSMSKYPENHPFGESFDAMMELLSRRNQDPLWRVKRALNVDFEREISDHLKVLDEFSHKLITEKRRNAKGKGKMTDESGSGTFDLFSLYYDHKESLTDDEMKYIAMNFIIAGRDTTRMLTSWFLYDLNMFPEVARKVVAEIDAFNQQHTGTVSYTEITKGFKYMEAAMCESLRYHPVVPFSVREARSDVVIPREICKPPHDGNYVIRKGDRCVIHQYTVSKLDRFYKNPMEYDPTRFLEKGVRTYSQGVYPFFNQNPRLCLGRDFALMEAKVFMYNFLSKYEVDVVKGQHITYTPGIILNMKNGLNIRLKLRK